SHTVQRTDHERVAVPQVVETGGPLWPLGDPAGLAVVDKHTRRTRRTQLRFLRGRILLTCRNSRVPYNVAHLPTSGPLPRPGRYVSRRCGDVLDPVACTGDVGKLALRGGAFPDGEAPPSRLFGDRSTAVRNAALAARARSGSPGYA